MIAQDEALKGPTAKGCNNEAIVWLATGKSSLPTRCYVRRACPSGVDRLSFQYIMQPHAVSPAASLSWQSCNPQETLLQTSLSYRLHVSTPTSISEAQAILLLLQHLHETRPAACTENSSLEFPSEAGTELFPWVGMHYDFNFAHITSVRTFSHVHNTSKTKPWDSLPTVYEPGPFGLRQSELPNH